MDNNDIGNEVINLVKRVIRPTAIMGFMGFMGFIALFVIWFYLNRLGRLDIFISSVTFKDLFIVIASTFLFSTVLTSIFMFIPSILLISIIKKESNQFHNYKKIRGNFVTIAFIISLLAVGIFLFSAWLADKFEYMEEAIIIISVLFVLSSSMLVSYLINKNLISDVLQYKNKRTRIKLSCLFHIIIPASIFLMTLFYSYPLSLIINKIPNKGEVSDNVLMLYVVATSLITVIFSLIPGSVYLSRDKSEGIVKNVYITGYAVIFSLFSLSWIITSIPVFIVNATMKISGISDYNEHSYLINEDNYPLEVFNNKQWNIRALEKNGFFLIDGVTLYAFGDIKLVCPVDVLEAYKNSLRFIPADRSYDEKLNLELRKKAKICHPFLKKELKEFNIIPSKIS
ncbi:hypothetical protein Ppb6_04401 [Photorhabdus australis subsp. thailandensis]|uniref:Uncharacterized protein n=1 Tax=Photorhabdus australis subsp. thailandensis TaxID=2805096 RepID=A0A1C0TY71_9GAMM|nr:hypothetical protein [Photorhabdus australis]OCQ50620.1 hypothetical protein Ppb6_04401 [Photorhabdus australis subsp. thailandensis]